MAVKGKLLGAGDNPPLPHPPCRHTQSEMMGTRVESIHFCLALSEVSQKEVTRNPDYALRTVFHRCYGYLYVTPLSIGVQGMKMLLKNALPLSLYLLSVLKS